MEFPPEAGPDIIRLIGLDPGTDTLGAAVMDVNMDTYEPTIVFGETHHASKAAKDITWKQEIRGGRDVRLEMHRRYLSELFDYTAPVAVAAESPFLKFGRVTSFEALVECYAVLRDTLWDYSPSMYLRRIDPITAKNYVGVSHIGTDKDDVRKAVIALYKDKCAEGVDIMSFDEHTIDAIAVTHCLLQKFLLNVEIASSKKKKKRGGRRRRKKGKKG